MKTWKLTLEYDGSRYSGWQEQTNARTVAGELRRACEEVLGCRVDLMGSGRTDAGVHAAGQVAHMRASSRRHLSPEQMLRLLNEELHYDVAVLALREVPPAFHARRSAVSRTYTYRFATRKSAFSKKYVWWIKDRLNVPHMARAVELLPGRHNFSQFRAEDPARTKDSPIVDVLSATLIGEEGLLLFRIQASHFLWRMVRRIAGTLVRLGTDEISIEDFKSLLENKPRKELDPAAWTAPASGLFLTSVEYRPPFDN